MFSGIVSVNVNVELNALFSFKMAIAFSIYFTNHLDLTTVQILVYLNIAIFVNGLDYIIQHNIVTSDYYNIMTYSINRHMC